MQITKASALDGKLLEGVSFGILSLDDILIEELTTNKNGTAVSSILDYGGYYLRELNSPDG